MSDFLTALAAILGAIFGGFVWHKNKIKAAKNEVTKNLQTRGAIVKVKLDAIDQKIEAKTKQKIKTITAKPLPKKTTNAANELRATRNEW